MRTLDWVIYTHTRTTVFLYSPCIRVGILFVHIYCASAILLFNELVRCINDRAPRASNPTELVSPNCGRWHLHKSYHLMNIYINTALLYNGHCVVWLWLAHTRVRWIHFASLFAHRPKELYLCKEVTVCVLFMYWSGTAKRKYVSKSHESSDWRYTNILHCTLRAMPGFCTEEMCIWNMQAQNLKQSSYHSNWDQWCAESVQQYMIVIASQMAK